MENPRRTVMKVSNPKYGSVVEREKFDKEGNIKKKVIIDRDASGKVIQKRKRIYRD
jgi:hypothetical protein